MPLAENGFMVLQAAWELSTLVVPALYLAALGYTVWTPDGTVVERVVTSQRGLVLQYGPAVTAGIILGGAATVLAGSVVPGLTIIVGVTLYTVWREAPRKPERIRLETWQGRLRLPWVAVPVLAAGAVLTGDVLLRSVVAVIFYSTIFWEL